MKKLLPFLSVLILLFPFSAYAAISAPWSATSTDKGSISPSLINGNNPFLKILSISTSTFSNGINLSNGCFAVNGVCVSGSGGSGTVTNIATTYPILGGPITTTGTLSLAFGTTTANSWSALQQFNGGLTTAGTVTLGTLTGVLHAASGVVSAAAVDLTSEVTGILPVANGGTGAASFTAGNRLVVSHGTSAFTDIALPLTVSNGGTGATSITGLVKGNGTGIMTAASNGTDYTLLTANTCSAGNHVSAITAAGVITCSPDTGSGGTGLATTTPIADGNLLVYSASGAGFAYGVATSTLTASSPLTGSFTQIGSGGSLGCQTASGSQAGCLTATDWTTFNNKQSALTFSTGLNNTGGTVTNTGVLSTSNSDGTLTISPTTGSVVASIALAHANTWTGLQQFNANASTTQLTSTGSDYLATASGGVNIGTTSNFGKALFVEGATSGGVAVLQRDFTSAPTNSLIGTYDVRLNEIGGLANGTGPAQTFGVEANGGAENIQADIASYRDGADTNGGLTFRTYLGGTPNQLITLTSAGSTIVGTGTTGAALDVTGTTTTSAANALDVMNSGFGVLLRVRNDGNVGIGTTSPYATLSVNAGTQPSSVPYFVIGSSTSEVTRIGPSTTGRPSVGIGTTSPYGQFSINPVAGETVAFVIGSSTATQFKVNTNGNLFVPNIGTLGTGDVLCRNTSTGQIGDAGGATCTISNPLAKHDIRPLTLSDLGNFMKLNPIHYELNGSNIAQYGFNALEVNKIYPDAVELATEDIQVTGVDGNPVTIKKGQPKTVDYEHLVALDTYMIQQQELSLEKLGAGVRANLTDDYQNWALGIMFLWLLVLTFRKNK